MTNENIAMKQVIGAFAWLLMLVGAVLTLVVGANALGIVLVGGFTFLACVNAL